MNIPVNEARAQLSDLVRRAEAGGADRPDCAFADPEPFEALVKDLQASVAKTIVAGPSAARSQDCLYDENGLPI